MRFLLYGINYAPELTATGKYTAEMAEWLASRGHEVRVVTAPPYYPAWRVGNGYVAHRYVVESLRAVTVFRSPLWVPKSPSGLKRLIHLASFALCSAPVMLRQIFWKPDVVWLVAPTMFCAPITTFVSRAAGSKSWLHIQDFEVDAAFELGMLKSGFFRRVVSFVERVMLRGFDHVSTISPRMVERLRAKGLKTGILFPNWVDINEIFPQQQTDAALRKSLGVAPGQVVVLYSGNMGQKQGLEILADAARLIEARSQSSHSIVFVFCGDGPARSSLMSQCQGLQNVRFLPLQPMNRLNDLLNLADIHLLPQRADAADLVMPSKLTGMMASGRPVVATAAAGTQIAEVVTGRGVVVAPENAAALAEAISSLASSPEVRKLFGHHAREYAVSQFSKSRVLANFERLVLAG